MGIFSTPLIPYLGSRSGLASAVDLYRIPHSPNVWWLLPQWKAFESSPVPLRLSSGLKRGLTPGLTSSNEFISRNEAGQSPSSSSSSLIGARCGEVSCDTPLL